eukprot:g11631.t1
MKTWKGTRLEAGFTSLVAEPRYTSGRSRSRCFGRLHTGVEDLKLDPKRTKVLHTQPGTEGAQDEGNDFIDKVEWECVANPLAWADGEADPTAVNLVAEGKVREVEEDGGLPSVAYPELAAPRCLTVVRRTHPAAPCEEEDDDQQPERPRPKIKVHLSLLLKLQKKKGLPTSVALSSGGGEGAEQNVITEEFGDIEVVTSTSTDVLSAGVSSSTAKESSAFLQNPFAGDAAPPPFAGHAAGRRSVLLDELMNSGRHEQFFGSAKTSSFFASTPGRSDRSIARSTTLQVGSGSASSSAAASSSRACRGSFQLGIAPCLRDDAEEDYMASTAGGEDDADDDVDRDDFSPDFEKVAGNQRFVWESAPEKAGVLAFAPKVSSTSAGKKAGEVSSCIDHRGSDNTFRPKYPPPLASVPAASQTLSAAEEPTSDPGDRDHDEVDHRNKQLEQEETFLPVPILNDAGFAVTQAWVQEMHPGLGYEAAARMAAGRAVLRVSYTSDDHSAWTILTDGLPIQGEGDQEGGNKCLSYLRQEQLRVE